jgi:PKD repeat protein
MLADSGTIVIDTTNLRYVWDFGDGIKASGSKVNHCFRGAGKYTVKLNIIEKSTGNLFFSKLIYKLDILDYKQPYINSPDIAIKEENLNFDGLRSNLPGFKVLNYLWNFGDGKRSSGADVSHSFKESGEHIVYMELTLKAESTGNTHKTGVTKKILVFNNVKEKESYLAQNALLKSSLPDLGKSANVLINTQFSAETEFQKEAVFNVEIYSSRNKVG